VAREGGAYPLLSGGDVNLYSLMVERSARLARADGIIGLLVPSGIGADLGAAPFFRSISTTGRLAALLDFENRRNRLGLEPFFPDVHSSFKFSALIFGGKERHFPNAECAFFKQSAEEAELGAFALAPEEFAAVNPNTGTAPVFRTPRDAAITKGIYARLPVLVDRREDPPRRLWPVRYLRMFDMTNDSGKFKTAAELRALGAYEVEGGDWEKGSARWVPLYEGKMVQAYDHRAASVVVNPANVNRPAQPEPANDAQHADPAWLPRPQFWVSISDIDENIEQDWTISYKMITAPTNARSFIAAILPKSGVGNSMGTLIIHPVIDNKTKYVTCIVSNSNSFVCDYVLRQKIQGQNINWYILEQLPFVRPDAFARRFGVKTAEAIIRDDVLALTYTAHDMAGFAKALGYDGPPFPWDAEDRLRRRARLDAIFFHLYGLDRDDADYVMGTFPIVREQEQAAYGRYRSRDLVLAYMAALDAGNPDARIVG
jgi:hypothetical protein